MITKANDHVGAKPVVEQAWRELHGREPTALETLYTQAIASLETGYGRLDQFGKLAAKGMYNWGGEQKKPNADGSCPTGYAKGEDQGSVCFFVYSTDVEAAKHFIRELTLSKLRPNVIAAMADTPEAVATAMRGTDRNLPSTTAYYNGTGGTEADRIRAYANGIRNKTKEIGGSIAVAKVPVPEAVKQSSIVQPLVIGAVGIAIAYGVFVGFQHSHSEEKKETV